MAIEISETFQVQAPVEAVCRRVIDSHRVATCTPGSLLEEVLDGRTFVGEAIPRFNRRRFGRQSG